MVNGKCVKTLAEEFLFSGTSCVHLCKLKSSEKSVRNWLINAMAMARWQKRQWWCFVAYRNQGRIYYSEYILFLFFWQRIRIFICDIPHPAAAAGSGGGGVWCLNLIMWLLLVHIIIILILHQHHLLPPPATAAAQYSIDSYTRSGSSAPLHVIGMWCATKMVLICHVNC